MDSVGKTCHDLFKFLRSKIEEIERDNRRVSSVEGGAGTGSIEGENAKLGDIS